MTKTIQRGSAQQLVGESIAPFAEVEVAGDDGGGAFITFGHQVMEVLIVGWTQRFQSEVVDDEPRQTLLFQARLFTRLRDSTPSL